MTKYSTDKSALYLVSGQSNAWKGKYNMILKRSTMAVLSLVISILFIGCAAKGLPGDIVPGKEKTTTKSNPTTEQSNAQVNANGDISQDTPVITDASTELPTEPPIPEKTVLSFIAAGDNIIHGNIYDDAKLRAKEGQTFNFDDMYTGMAHYISGHDIALINQETPIAGSEFPFSGYPNFNSPAESAQALIDLGFDIVTLANNHMLDKGEKGYINSIEYWKSKTEVLAVGAYENAEDYEKIRIYEKSGIKIAVLTYTYGTNGMKLPAGSTMIIPMIDKTVMDRHITMAKQQADLVFVVMHWGNEDAFEPTSTQKDLAQFMVDRNVDAIIGMHPHVIEPIKWADRPDGKKCLLAYSLGNLISTMNPGRNMLGALLRFDIFKSGDEITLHNALMIPVITHYDSRRHNLQVYDFKDYTPELAKAHGTNDQPYPFSYDYILGLIKDTIDPAFLDDFYK